MLILGDMPLTCDPDLYDDEEGDDYEEEEEDFDLCV